MARSASFAVLTGATLLVSTVGAQDTEEPNRYSPPVHIQPVAWSVLEDEFPRSGPGSASASSEARTEAPRDFARAREIANMSHYMRMQNEAVTAAKNAQVNAAVYQKQYSQAMATQNPPPAAYVPRQQYSYPQPAPVQVATPVQNVPRVRYTAPQSTAPRRSAPRQAAGSNSSQRVVKVSQKTQTRPQPQTQARRGIGLQDRISLAIRKSMERSRQRNEVPVNKAQTIPASVQSSRTRLVQHQQEIQPTEAEMLPMLADPIEVPELARQKPRNARNLEYRPEMNSEDGQVIVPSFVDSDSGMSLELASTQETVRPAGRRPRVTSRSQPIGYASGRQDNVSVFQNAKVQIGQEQDSSDSERLRKLGDELDARRSQSGDNELPQRPGVDDTSLLDMDDADAADEARRARSQLDAEMDEIEDEDDDFDVDEDEDDESPPVFDERGCEELRSLLIDRSIRDISLDISPPASPRRFEIGSISRAWTDQSGNVIGNGTMIDLRRGYVILDSGQKLPYAKLSEADWSAIAENWLLPSVCSIGQRGSLQRHWVPQTVTWHASSLCHKPLYFENVQLERYGHSHGPIMQPIRSAIHFFGSIIFLPYNTAIHPPNECRYALGYYRPGNCAPWLLDPIPFSRDAIRRQALATVGAAFIP